MAATVHGAVRELLEQTIATRSAIDGPLCIVRERQHVVAEKTSAVEKADAAAEVALFPAQTYFGNARAETHFSKANEDRSANF